VTETLYRALEGRLNSGRPAPGEYDQLLGVENVDRVVNVDQAPIGRTPRSNPATYIGAFGPIRELFATLPEARRRGYQPGRFSFNRPGGRCEQCEGYGSQLVSLRFLPDVWVTCEACKGKRYNRETLAVRYKGKSIADVLDLTVAEAMAHFASVPSIVRRLQVLMEVGLSYLQLGQSGLTLSVGEAQRVKLARELSERSHGRTVYILDEPTTGLHPHDVLRLLYVLDRLVAVGHTVIVIEHNLDVIKCADYIIDLGPEGGDEGGRIIARGTPEQVAKREASYTGQFLRGVLSD
jgi:excinuclease ABC subunit A